MILTYLFFILLAIIAFFITYKLKLVTRVGLAFAVFAIPSAFFTLWLLHVGDKAPPDAITIIQSEEPTKNLEKGD